MRIRTLMLAASVLLAGLVAAPLRAQQQKKEYLSDTEADKIRDSYFPADKIKLFVSFAADRIKKLQYMLAHPGDTPRLAEQINFLVNGYAGCVDDATDLIDVGVEKQQDIRDGIKEMQNQAPGFLAYLKQIEDKVTEIKANKDNLDDAIDATTDAIKTADEAAKENAPPVRRKLPS